MIVFINPYKKIISNRFSKFSPVFPPIGLGYLASIAIQKNIEFKIYDQQIDYNIKEKIINEIKDKTKKIVFAYSVVTPAISMANEIAIFLKKTFPYSVNVFGGIHPTALPYETISNQAVDFVVKGEAETIFFNLYESILYNDDYSKIPNIVYKVNDKIIQTPTNDELVDISKLPDFPYELFDQNKYDLGVILSSRGCKKNCIFCSHHIISKYKIRYNKASKVVNTIELLINKYNIKHILFLDDNFLEDKNRILEICEIIREKKLNEKCKFSFQGRCDQVEENLLDVLYQSGFRTIFLGIETISKDQLRNIKKGLNPEQIKKAISIAYAKNFKIQASFIFGYPDESEADRIETLLFALNSPIDIAKFNNVVPYPGTKLYDISSKNKVLNFSEDYSNANTLIPLTTILFSKPKFPLKQNNTDFNTLNRFILLAYFSFYFRVKNIRNIIKQNSESIRWLYIKNTFGKFSFSRIFNLIILILFLMIKFVPIIFYPSKQNFFYFIFISKKKYNA